MKQWHSLRENDGLLGCISNIQMRTHTHKQKTHKWWPTTILVILAQASNTFSSPILLQLQHFLCELEFFLLVSFYRLVICSLHSSEELTSLSVANYKCQCITTVELRLTPAPHPPNLSPPTHACPQHSPNASLQPTPPLAKLPPSTPHRAPVAKRQRERDGLRRHSQSILQREGEKEMEEDGGVKKEGETEEKERRGGQNAEWL